jgi:hypothetical protein
METWLRTRLKYFGECYERAQNHRLIWWAVAITSLYSFLSNIAPVVNYPELPIPKLSLSWAAVVFVLGLLLLVVEGGYRQTESLKRLIAGFQSIEYQLTVEIKEAEINSRLIGTGSEQFSPDPAIGWDVFLSVFVCSSLHISISEYSLTLNGASGGISYSRGPIQDLQGWRVNRNETTPGMFGEEKVNKVRKEMDDLSSLDSLPPNVRKSGWLHFVFEKVPVSKIENDTLNLTLKDAKGRKHYASFNAPRSYQNALVWPKQI